MVSPLPFGAKLVHGGRLEHPEGPEEFAIYELEGEDAIPRIRSTAERSGFTVINADSQSVTLMHNSTRIMARRGHALQNLITAGGDIATDDQKGTAAILVWNKVPQWRAALKFY